MGSSRDCHELYFNRKRELWWLEARRGLWALGCPSQSEEGLMGPRVASTGKPGSGAPHTPCSHPAGERGTRLLVRSCRHGVAVLCGALGNVQVLRWGGSRHTPYEGYTQGNPFSANGYQGTSVLPSSALPFPRRIFVPPWPSPVSVPVN